MGAEVVVRSFYEVDAYSFGKTSLGLYIWPVCTDPFALIDCRAATRVSRLGSLSCETFVSEKRTLLVV